MKNIKAAIFDVDGTLIDSMQLWDNGVLDYLIDRKKTPQPNLYDELREFGGHDTAKYLKKNYDLQETELKIETELVEMITRRYEENAPLKDGALETLILLKERGIKMCAATASERVMVEPTLERLGILGYFGRIFTCTEENTSKSKPDIYIKCAEFLGTEISETLVFEDALYAVKSAKKGGFPVVGLYDFTSDADQPEIIKLADYYYTSLLDFVEEFSEK